MQTASVVLVSDIGILLFNLLFKRSYHCQNPNLTTTQPQPNTPTTTTTHRNSTSSRNNDPRGLKFCRRPYQANLTIIQRNFNPTIFLGGGHTPSTLGLPYLFFRQIQIQIFLTKILFIPKTFYPKFFLTQNFYDPKNFWPKIFLTQNFFYPNFFDPKIFWPTIFLTQNFFNPKFF